MKATSALYGAVLLLAAGLAAQTANVVPITSEPHHHLALENDYVRLFQVEVPAHESTLLHRHDHDYVYVVLGEAQLTNLVSGKPPVALKVADGDIHFTRGGFAHVARNDGATPFRVVAIELLHPQGAVENLCAGEVAPGAPVQSAGCAGGEQSTAVQSTAELQTDQTRVLRVVVAPHQHLNIGAPPPNSPPVAGFDLDPQREHLLVALDRAVSAPAAGKGMERLLQPGDFLWIGPGMPARIFKNDSDKPARFMLLEFKPQS
jgi:quercetin dioxygenase-like cupin family protein